MAALLAAATASGPVAALGLGPARVDSRLNERLEAWIPLQDTATEAPRSLDVGLAEAGALPDADAATLRPGIELRFEVQNRPEGGRFIRVTSARPVTEPYLRFLLRVDGTEGRLLREYTLLLDPPAGVTDRPPPTTAAAPATPDRADGGSPRTYGPVQQGESAWEIAMATKAAAASVHQMMAALLEANPEAFAGGNLNRLRAGATLTLPPPRAVTAIPRGRAVATYRRAAGLDPETPQVAAAGDAGDAAADAADAADAAATAAPPPETADAAAPLSPIAAARAAPAGDGATAGAAADGTGDASAAVAQRLAALEREIGDIRATLDAETERLGDTLAAQSRALDALRASVDRIGGRLERIAARPATPTAAATAPAPAMLGVAALAGGVLGGLAGVAAGRRRAAPARAAPAVPDGAQETGPETEPAPASPARGAEAADATAEAREGTWPPPAAGYSVVSFEEERTAGRPAPPAADDARFWADLYVVEGWPLEAVRVLREAIAHDGDSADYRLGLLEALYQAGAADEFAAERARFAELAAANDPGWAKVHEMEAALGRGEAAGVATGGGDTAAAPARDDPPGAGADEGGAAVAGDDRGVEATVEFEPPDLSDLDDVAPVHGGAPREPEGPEAGDGRGNGAPGSTAEPGLPDLDPLPALDADVATAASPDDPANAGSPPADDDPREADGTAADDTPADDGGAPDEEIELRSEDDPAMLDLTPDDPAEPGDQEATRTIAAGDPGAGVGADDAPDRERGTGSGRG